jgi:hypothetical protein
VSRDSSNSHGNPLVEPVGRHSVVRAGSRSETITITLGVNVHCRVSTADVDRHRSTGRVTVGSRMSSRVECARAIRRCINQQSRLRASVCWLTTGPPGALAVPWRCRTRYKKYTVFDRTAGRQGMDDAPPGGDRPVDSDSEDGSLGGPRNPGHSDRRSPSWTLLSKKELVDAYWNHVAPVYRADGHDPNAERSSHEWLRDNGFRGLVYALRKYRDRTSPSSGWEIST